MQIYQLSEVMYYPKRDYNGVRKTKMTYQRQYGNRMIEILKMLYEKPEEQPTLTKKEYKIYMTQGFLSTFPEDVPIWFENKTLGCLNKKNIEKYIKELT